MTKERRQAIAQDIDAAASTCNAVVALMQEEETDISKKATNHAIAVTLVGINQALVSIARILFSREERSNEPA